MSIAPSSYYEHERRERETHRRRQRARRDPEPHQRIRAIHRYHHGAYGERKGWRALVAEGVAVARCAVERLMRAEGLVRVMYGGRRRRTRRSDPRAVSPPDRVRQQIVAERPGALRMAGFTYAATWSALTYVAFVLDVFSRRIVGWCAAHTMRTERVLDALEQALRARGDPSEVVHHSDRSAHLSLRYGERLRGSAPMPRSETAATVTITRWPGR